MQQALDLWSNNLARESGCFGLSRWARENGPAESVGCRNAIQ